MVTSSRRILLVEDHNDTAAVLARLLGMSGYTVKTAASVASAIEIFENHPFDLLISDVGLPDGTGYELMRELIQRREVKGIAVSGYATEEDIESAKSAGFSEHLVKPVAFDALHEAIRRVIPG